MDSRSNPYAPGAGNQPPELAGRGDIIARSEVALDRIRNRRSARSFIFYGLRGVGKTVLLHRIRVDCEAAGFGRVTIEGPEGRSHPAILAPALRARLLRLSRREAAKAHVQRALQALAGFTKALKVKYADLEVGVDLEPEPGLTDSGDLDSDLSDLLRATGIASREAATALVLFIDEVHYVPEAQFAAMITVIHHCSQDGPPVTMMAAGLPQLLGQMGRAKSHAERLFEFVAIDRLDEAAATIALCRPAENEGVMYRPDAIWEILLETEGYPYFLQEWGKHSRDAADAPPIEREDAREATGRALAELDASFFRVRFDRLTPKEKEYLQAMALLGPGPHRSGDVADRLGRKVTAVAPVRNALIGKGMIYSPSHSDTAFTVPLFDAFMRRIMN